MSEFDRRQALGLGRDDLAQQGLSRAGGDRRDCPAENVVQFLDSALNAQLLHRTGAGMNDILPDWLAQFLFAQKYVAQIICDLKRLADSRAKLDPGLGLGPGGRRAHGGRRNEERACLGHVIRRQIDLLFAFPALPSTDPTGHTCRTCELRNQRPKAVRRLLTGKSQHVERSNNQGIAGQKGQRLRKRLVNCRLSTTDVSVIETWQIIMDK